MREKRVSFFDDLTLKICESLAFALQRRHRKVNARTTVEEVLDMECFHDFRQFLFPGTLGKADLKKTLSGIAPLFPYHKHVNTEVTLEVLQFMRERAESGERIFYDIYSEEEKNNDPTKRPTGMFFFRGIPCAPFAVVCPGGSFAYLASLHESLPHAVRLSRRGFNAFALCYRTDSAEAACEDLAAAITFVFDHAFELGIDTECYSLWGSSVGAHIAAYLTSYGPQAFGGKKLPRAGTLVMQYTGHTNHTRQEPPTYVCVGENDGMCDWQVMKKRCDALAACGIDTEFHKYPHLGHGFGLGIGTEAEGWIESAIAFWKRHLPARARRVLKRLEMRAAGA